MPRVRVTALLVTWLTLAVAGGVVAQEPVWRNLPATPVVRTRPAPPAPVAPVAPVAPAALPAPTPVSPVTPPAKPAAMTPWAPGPNDAPRWSASPTPATPPETPVPMPMSAEVPESAPVITVQVVAPVPPPSEPLPLPRTISPDGPAETPKPPAATTEPPPPSPRALPPSTASNELWGASPAAHRELEPYPGVGGGDAALPVRGDVRGSPNLTLSRDYSLLDVFGVGLFGEDAETLIHGQPAPADRSFVQVEYLLWWVQAGKVPVLASTATGQSQGYLGTPGTEVLLGPGNFGSTARNGFRARAGTMLDDCGQSGVDGSLFVLGRQTTTARIDSNQFPTIARPIFAPNFNREFAELVAFPGLSTGALQVETSSFLWGADLNYRCSLCRTCDARTEIFAGYRHLNLHEDLKLTEFITAGPNAPDPAGTQIVVQDSFTTRNRFHGGQVGYAFARRSGRFEFDGRLSVALGVNSQRIDIAGVQNRVRPGQALEQFSGGLLAAGPNLGTFSRDRFSVAPEATFNLGVRLTPNFKAYVGYNFLYWTNVIRPGEQIDRVVDLTFVPNAPRVPFGQNRPLPTFDQSNLWAQGLQFGLEFRW